MSEILQLILDFTDGSRPKKPAFQCSVWDEWYEMKSFGYSNKELNQRIKYEQEMYARWTRQFREFQKQKTEDYAHAAPNA
jgi:hypothetical protein